MTANLALMDQPSEPLSVHSDLLGPLQVEATEVLHFRTGLYGFPEARDFVLLPAGRDGLYWLQSIQHSALTFLLADPFVPFPGYAVELGPMERRELKVGSDSQVAILAIVRLPDAPDGPATANLQGPLALNLGARLCMQLALAESEFGLACEFELPGGN